jgi:hypothetical protein
LIVNLVKFEVNWVIRSSTAHQLWAAKPPAGATATRFIEDLTRRLGDAAA